MAMLRRTATLGFRSARAPLLSTMAPSASTSSPAASPKRARHNVPVLRVKKLTELAILPARGSQLAAGLDLAAAYDAVVPAGGKALVKTDLCIAVPEGCYARVAPRSGLALKKFIDTGAGVIDADYRGNVGVILFNHASEDFEVKRGDRIAQLILEKIEYPDVLEVDEIDDTERGAGGFGSTGVENPPAKRSRAGEEDASSRSPNASEYETAFAALERLTTSGAIDGGKRQEVKKALLTASDRQFGLLNKALGDYLQDGDHAKVLEWIEAFAASKN